MFYLDGSGVPQEAQVERRVGLRRPQSIQATFFAPVRYTFVEPHLGHSSLCTE